MSEYLLVANESERLISYAVHPVPARGFLDADFVQIMNNGGGQAWLQDIDVKTPNGGRGTVLLHAAVTWARDRGLNTLSGSFNAAPGQTRRVQRWYRNRGIGIERGYLTAEIETVWGICGQILSNWGVSYQLLP